ncbi:FAD dependent oxidoreductase [Blakeslea trispora]|nr:FAD dependent oxidoreductase [Blakeslea trispora]
MLRKTCINRITYSLGKRAYFSTTRTADLEVDNIVVGAGVVGLAIGEKLTRERPFESTIVIEKNKRIGEETSARNSEVIHAGLYYPEQSLKTKLCIEGKHKLYSLLEKTSIRHCRLGKWVVAQNKEQHLYLEGLHQKATRLGVETYFLNQTQAYELEPEVRAYSVMVSPSTGIIDSHQYMDYLEQKISQNGDIALNTSLRSIQPSSGGYLLEIATPSNAQDTTFVFAKRVFNAAGLHADKVSNMLMPDKYRLYYARGHYFSYSGSTSIKHLIYPCPEKNLAGLGTHLTLDLAGKIKFGPDVQYIEDPYDYRIPDEEQKRELFAKAIQSYFPNVRKEQLNPDYAGIRPKLAAPGEPFQDFVITEETESGHDNFFTLIGIESPGLTSSLAIADYVYSVIQK